MHSQVQNGILIKKEKEKDQLRMGGGSWSINLDELKTIPEAIHYITEKSTYKISYKDAMEHSFVRILGGERKLVVPINKWERS